MTARFAGSRTLDERRRRWLASNENEQVAGSKTGKPQRTSAENPAPVELWITQFPIRKVISPKGWKIAGVGVLVLLCGAAIVALGADTVQIADWLKPGWTRLVGPGGGKLARLFHAGLLMASGQLALLIWWGRTQSLRDFDGRYYVWLWSGLTAQLAGWALLGDWHWVWSDILCTLWSARFPMREVVCWMAPGVFIAGVLWRMLRADMRDCRCSSVLLWLGAFACLGACLFRLEVDRTGLPVSVKDLVYNSLLMLTCVSVFVSFLVHARFVLHVSAEPPEKRPSLSAKAIAGGMAVLRKLPKPRLKWPFPQGDGSKKPKTKPKKKADKKSQSSRQKTKATSPTEGTNAKTSEADKSKNETNSPEKPAKKTSGRKPKKTETSAKATKKAAQTSKPAPQADEPEQPKSAPSADKKAQSRSAGEKEANPSAKPASSTSAKPKSAASSQKTESAKPTENPPKSEPKNAKQNDSKQTGEKPKSSASEPQLRADEPLDPEMLKGLSKKERRRLRKQHREAQRKKS